MDFVLLPQQYFVEFSATIPYVEARFYVVNFLPRPITLVQAKVSIRLYAAASLESITLINEDFQIPPKQARMVFCRRNMTDMEVTKVPWRFGWETGALQLSAKAVDGAKTISYGPVSARVIEGWVNGPLPKNSG